MPPELERARGRMVERQLRGRGIEDEDVLAAMGRVPREAFLPEAQRRRAYEDAALPIGHGQTISQPFMVALIVEVLAVRPGQRILDVGTGSGYQAALLAELGAEVVTIERIPELAEQARADLAAAGYDGVEVVVGDGTLGWPERAPYDGIAVAAAAPKLPQALYDQLKLGGRLVVPMGGRRAQQLEVIVRSPEGPATIHSVPCRFVPLVGEEGYAP
jgi:protein-L-isoaspartate(D-aspartate) O-methyltransferase